MKKMKPTPARRADLREAGTYVFFGVLTTLFNWAVYWTLTELLGLRAHDRGSAAQLLKANSASVVAWVLSVLFAYVTNKRFVFKSTASGRQARREFVLFVSARLLSLVLFDVALFSAFILFLDDRVAKLLMNALVVLFNYFASRWVVFSQRKQASSIPPAPVLGNENQAQKLQDRADG